MNDEIPVVLFAYARPDYLVRTLACLCEEKIPLLYVFSDGPKTPEVEPNVLKVRKILHQIDWCEVHIIERENNLGLGASILSGVTEILQKHEEIIVFEDDLICVAGTYKYLCAALEQYKKCPSVMSVTGWTHPRVKPSNIIDQPYFDGRTDCLVWGAWRRSWIGMEQDSLSLISSCEKQGIDVYRYGADLFEMAKFEKTRNIWAVRFSYLHILRKGICLRPPYSLVEHIGYDPLSSNVSSKEEYNWYVELPKECPTIPTIWPEPFENSECPSIWQRECGTRPELKMNLVKRILKFIKNR